VSGVAWCCAETMAELPSFGPFQLVQRLGRGGMAETFIAERRGLAGFSQRVCLKRVLPALCANPVFIAMFQEEARLAARLVHPHIAQIYDFGADDGQWWMALELVDGVDLRTLLDAVRALDQPMPLDLVVLILTDVCSALVCAHGAEPSVVHRDVTPSNVLLSREGAVKLADFGIAKQTSGDQATASGIKGKVPYMAPEQALGGRIDARTDLFALGVMSFELLTGRRPFDGPTELATLSNLAADRRPDLAPLAPHAPPALVALVEQLLAPAPDARPESAAALLDVLSAHAPPLRARRALGVMVERARVPSDASVEDVPSSVMVVARTPGTDVATPAAPSPALAAPLDLPAPAGTRAAAHPATPAHAPRVPPRRAVFTLFLLGIVVIAGLTFALLRGSIPLPARPPAAAHPASPRSVPRRADSEPDSAHRPTVTAVPTTAPADVAAAPPTTRRGTLVVTAYPWGFVEIDGRALGRAPVRAILDEGEHRVRVRAEGTVKTRRARVVAGETREVIVSID